MSITSSIFLILIITGLIYILIDTDEDSIVRQRIQGLSKQSKKETASSKFIDDVMEMVKPFASLFSKEEGQKEALKNQLIQAGKDFSDEAILKFSVLQFVLTVTCIPFAIYLAMAGDLILAAISVLLPFSLYVLPKMVLSNIIKMRQKEIRRFLPDTLELLTVCVEAGLGLDAALARVAKEYKRSSPVISQEFERVNRDILSGVSREHAFRGLANRTKTEELKSFVALLIQSDKMGTSIARALRVYCDTIRTKKRQRIEELSQQAATKMVIPMVGCLLPALFAIILSPAIMIFTKTMK